jgi:hypothetical protein
MFRTRQVLINCRAAPRNQYPYNNNNSNNNNDNDNTLYKRTARAHTYSSYHVQHIINEIVYHRPRCPLRSAWIAVIDYTRPVVVTGAAARNSPKDFRNFFLIFSALRGAV